MIQLYLNYYKEYFLFKSTQIKSLIESFLFKEGYFAFNFAALMNQKLRKHLSQLERSATLALNERSAEMVMEGKTVYRFGFGQSPFPVPSLIVSALQENAYRKDYLPVEGLMGLREAVAEFHSNVDKLNVEPSGIIIGPGSKELMYILQMALEGSTILPSPCWVSYAPQTNLVRRDQQYIHTDKKNNWRLQPDQLSSAIENSDGPHLLILNYPGNPEGGTYRPNELEALAEVAREHQLIILSDEIYGRLHHDNEHMSIARYYPEGTIVSSGLSKWCGAGGWRLGHFAFPKELYWLKDAISSIASDTYSCVSAPIQHAAVAAYTDQETVNDYLFHCRRILKTIGNYCSNSLNAAHINVFSPSGAFYLFPDFSGNRDKLNTVGVADSPSLCEKLLNETGVALLPGNAFGRPENELNARLAYVNFDGGNALSISKEVPSELEFSMKDLGDCADPVKHGINKIIEWINE